MHDKNLAFATPADATTRQRWLVFSPLARIITFTAMMIALSFPTHMIVAGLGWTKAGTPVQHALGTLSLQLVPVLIAYLVLVRLIERRPMCELALRSIPTFGIAGLVSGAVLFSVVVAVLWLLGSYHVTGTRADVAWLPAVLVAGIGAGIGEEVVTRGVLFRITEEGLGTWSALAISAVFFGAMHIFNPGATVWSSVAIAIEAGLLLALIYHVTRSLWACIGLHAAWNIMQGTVYGIPVSGGAAEGWLISNRTGPDWLSGGLFGAEASVVALLTCSIVTLALLIVAFRRKSIVAPAWVRRRATLQEANNTIATR
ncbi:CPBP family intramembrane glutamic endopeptidase [Dyella tabacisoli]|uniref:CPBP family intramembrane metalloprotease n=1 Tax=Dyella tabacisoli TaxID=2282381 RepID=A0A369UJ55_9GAMM|nr:CPBP family intramembrane glutamic endopeptidase [Dyella tabacisoli]RDD80547.1 CPBP family intramembrane metalloprotease [Dyella tabacisoli]